MLCAGYYFNLKSEVAGMKRTAILTASVLSILLLSTYISSKEVTKDNNKWLVKPQFEHVDINGFSEGLAAVKKNGKWGYIGKDGKIKIEPRYDLVYGFSGGLAMVMSGSKTSFINSEGVTVFTSGFDHINSEFSEGLAGFKHKDKWGFVNKQGAVVIEPQFEHAYKFQGGMARIYKKGYIGFINKDGTIVIKPQFKRAQDFSEGLAMVEKDGVNGFIDKEGNMVISKPEFSNVGMFFSEGLCKFWLNNKCGFIDKTGKIVIENIFNDAGNFSEGYAWIYDGSKYGFIDKQGKNVIKQQYGYVGNFSEGLARFSPAGYYGSYGFIDKEGRVVIKPQFIWNSIKGFSEGACSAATGGVNGWGFLKNTISASTQGDHLRKTGQMIGVIGMITGKEITVNSNDNGGSVFMGDTLCLYSGDTIIILRVTFPMMTVSRCELISGNRPLIKVGMKVYKYRKPESSGKL
jgi:hypothetical protein